MAAVAPGTRRIDAAQARLLDQVFDTGALGALTRVRLKVAHASGERPGHTRVRNRSDGSGTEIERHVSYTPGDDLRRIDWSAYARLGELLTRRFVAEREVPVWILIDTSASMGEATRASKLDLAASVAAILSVVSLSGGDRLYLGAVPGRRRTREPLETCGPLRGRRSLGELRRFLTELSPSPQEGDFAEALLHALRHVRRGLVVLISDFLVPPERIAPALDVIRTRGCEGKVVQVLSREDLDPSWLRGQGKIVDRETGEEYVIEPSVQTWKRYEEALGAHLDALRRDALSRGMSSIVTLSDVALERFLREELPRLGLSLVR
ncbi:MAG: DUF58 domain-containing protein [Deltaproteobacteria bacterium]|nr:DUF58 domain-containing protein [Deltaproteobacteria bacterium]